MEHQSSEDAEAWIESLEAPFPGEAGTARYDEFDDSFDQINQQ